MYKPSVHVELRKVQQVACRRITETMFTFRHEPRDKAESSTIDRDSNHNTRHSFPKCEDSRLG